MTKRQHPSRSRSLLRFAAGDHGATAVVLAVAFPVLIGGMALGAEVGYWFLGQRELQAAADVAAHAAGVKKRSGGDADAMRTAAVDVASSSGFEAATDTLELYAPPQSGAYAGDSDSVEVLLTRQQPRYFTLIYETGPVSLDARAVAEVQNGSTACLLALSSSAGGAVTVSGSTQVDFQGCDVASNSLAPDAFLMNSGASVLTTGCINTVGGTVTTAGLTLTDCSQPNEGAPPAADPYADVPEPELTGTCQSGNVGSNNSPTTVSPTESHASGATAMRFCSGLSVSGDVTFEPGLYIVEGGDFRANANASLSGDGVTFFLGDGVNTHFNGTADINFSAPTSGPYSGLLLFGSRTATIASHTMNGTASSALDGAVYAPASHLDFSGNFSWNGGCTQLVASTVHFTGNSELEVNCQAAGTRPIKVRQEVRLVE